MTEYSFIVEQKHIDIRDHAAITYNGSDLFRGACELPEYHQCEIDPNQTLYPVEPGSDFRPADTIHTILGVLDYKIDSKEGIFISKSTEKHIRNGIINAILTWSWAENLPNNLKINDKLRYIIKGWIAAKVVLDYIDKHPQFFKDAKNPKAPGFRRFKYEKLNVL